jgi:hypothetical protein
MAAHIAKKAAGKRQPALHLPAPASEQVSLAS